MIAVLTGRLQPEPQRRSSQARREERAAAAVELEAAAVYPPDSEGPAHRDDTSERCARAFISSSVRIIMTVPDFTPPGPLPTPSPARALPMLDPPHPPNPDPSLAAAGRCPGRGGGGGGGGGGASASFLGSTVGHSPLATAVDHQI